VFVQAGDIVKGGRQDRVLTVSLLIPPRSGRMAIGAYCVEQVRWSQRGHESAKKFMSAEGHLPSLEAKRSLANETRKVDGSIVHLNILAR
jgi:hypothetical protein